MSEPTDPSVPPPYAAPPPPPAYGAAAPPPPYGAPPAPAGYGAPPAPPPYGGQPGYGYGPPPGQRVNDPAPMGMRLLARIIDAIVTGAVSGAIAYAVGIHIFSTHTNVDGTHEADFRLYNGDFFKVFFIGLLVTGAYEVGMLVSRGATLGKMAVGVRVAMLADGSKPTPQAALVRWIIPAGAALFPLAQLVVYLSPFFDSTHRNRGWYDNAANTIAVRTR